MAIELVPGLLQFTSRLKNTNDHDLIPSLHYPLSWYNMFCNKRHQRFCKYQDHEREMPFFKKLINFFWVIQMVFTATRKEKGRSSNVKRKLSKLLFLNTYYKSQTRPHFGAWSLVLVQVWFTTSQGHKGHFQKSDHGSVTMKCDHAKMPPDVR